MRKYEQIIFDLQNFLLQMIVGEVLLNMIDNGLNTIFRI
jgi:hypothetical protein